jgi:7-carboxy-7-deazaguanine synthase
MIPLNMQPIEKQVNDTQGNLDVVHVWYTLQGEGPFAGTPAVFLRLAGCDLQCPQCFGTAIKSRIPYLTKSFGPSVRMDKVKEGEKILTFDKDFQLVETEVRNILHRTVIEWLEIQISGYTYDVTLDHLFFTTRGLIEAKDLVVGDDILEARPNEIISFKKKGIRNPIHNPGVLEKKIANTDYKASGEKVSRTIRKKQHEGTYVHPFDLISPEQKQEIRRRQSEAKRREKNPNWTGLQPNLLDLEEAIANGRITKCAECGEGKERLLVHHKDGNHNNDTKLNLIVWCHKCHNQHHKRGYNFWKGERKDGKELIQKHNGQKVEGIRKSTGKLPVVNLTCAPHPTYLANGMWVHNCDTLYTTGRHLLSVPEIISKVQSLMPKPGLVVLTGGEPLRQNIVPLIFELYELNYGVQIETNGTLFPIVPDGWVMEPSSSQGTIVCSPKTGSINERLKPFIDHLKYIVAYDKIDEEDGLPTDSLGAGVRVARPWSGFKGQVWIQPLDEQDEERNKLHLKAAADVCMKFGYRLTIQIHKLVGLD